MATSYQELLQHPKWQKKRLEILERDEYTCQLCQDTETQLQIHHLEYSYGINPWEYSNDKLITYCAICHALEEFLKKEFTNLKIALIFYKKNQGDSILIECYLHQPFTSMDRYHEGLFIYEKQTKRIRTVSIILKDEIDYREVKI